MSPSWHLKFWGSSYIFWKLMHPCVKVFILNLEPNEWWNFQNISWMLQAVSIRKDDKWRKAAQQHHLSAQVSVYLQNVNTAHMKWQHNYYELWKFFIFHSMRPWPVSYFLLLLFSSWNNKELLHLFELQRRSSLVEASTCYFHFSNMQYCFHICLLKLESPVNDADSKVCRKFMFCYKQCSHPIFTVHFSSLFNCMRKHTFTAICKVQELAWL
jgi:hypothetical protein